MKALCLTLCALLAGCGGGGTSAPPAAASCNASARVLLLGDSTMFQIGPNLAVVLAQKHGGRIELVNAAVPGQELARFMPSDTAPVLKAAQGFDLVILNHGMNDMQHRLPLLGYSNRLQSLKGALGSRLLMQTQNPNVHETWKTEAQPAFVEAMRKASRGDLIDVYEWFQGRDWPALIPDGVHPNEAAQDAIAAEVIAPAIEAAVNVCQGVK